MWGLSAPAKPHNKLKNVLTALVEGCEAGRLEARSATTADSESDMSDCSDVSSITTASQENKYYYLKLFLQQTKCIKGLNIENYFPDILLFLNSARHCQK